MGAIWGMSGSNGNRIYTPTPTPTPFTHAHVLSHSLESVLSKMFIRFSGKKKLPGFQVSGPVSMVIWKFLSPNRPIKSRQVQRILERGAFWEMAFLALLFPGFRC